MKSTPNKRKHRRQQVGWNRYSRLCWGINERPVPADYVEKRATRNT